MKRFIPLFFLIILISACKKTESDSLWEKSYGRGAALFIKTTSDSGFVTCGHLEGNPYLLKLDKNKVSVTEFKGENPGLLNSLWFDTLGYIAGGNASGKMLLMRLSRGGRKLWEKSINTGFRVDFTNILSEGNGKMLAIGTASPDSSGTSGLYFVKFDTTGLIISEKKFPDPLINFVSASQAVIDNSGSIYLSFTRKTLVSKPKASVAKFNDQLARLWETELYNNPEFGAASVAINSDVQGNIFVAGNTEVLNKDGKLENSFTTSLSNAGVVRWKRYLENSNSGAALGFNNNGELIMLNKNCFIVNILSTSDGLDAGRIKMFSVCDSYNTDAFGSGFAINFDKNILLAGTRGGSYYLALKPSL